MPTPIFQVDAFTSEPFSGNPAGVCPLELEPPEEWMQAVAAEMNVAETAFVTPRPDGEFSIRWFTPTTEVPLCGHATLASAHTLWEQGRVPPGNAIRFHTRRSGQLIAARDGEWICLDFPARPVELSAAPPGLIEALGVQPVSVHRGGMCENLAELDSAGTVRGVRPDFDAFHEHDIKACIITAPSDTDDCDFVSRFFAPGLGIDEDPVTGAAHCSLAPFWAERLERDELTGHQVSKRGGVVKVRAKGARVHLLGRALTVLAGEMLIDPGSGFP